MPKIWRILSVDGGGIRGLIPSTILAAIEARTQSKIVEMFDIFAGTSTGGLIALAIGASGSQTNDASALVELYETRGTDIFPPSWVERHAMSLLANFYGTISHLVCAKYRASNFQSVLSQILGSGDLAGVNKEILVTSFDLLANKGYLFSSARAKKDNNFNCPLVTAGLATAAAPTYFNPVLFQPGIGLKKLLVDGGLLANNPSVIALEHTLRNFAQPGDELFMLSLGTGVQHESMNQADVASGGQWHWRKHALRITFENSISASHIAARELITAYGGKYYRFQVDVPGSLSSRMDNISSNNQKGIKLLTAGVTGSIEFDECCSDLLTMQASL